jgi:hypothetical protein
MRTNNYENINCEVRRVRLGDSFPFLISSIGENRPSQLSEALHTLQLETVPINLLPSPSFPILFCWPSR